MRVHLTADKWNYKHSHRGDKKGYKVRERKL